MSSQKRHKIIFYRTEAVKVEFEVLFEDENFWLTQKKMGELFGVETQTINYHLKQIFESGELIPEATIRNFRIVQKEGNRNVQRSVEFYNLDGIISVGYRVNSKEATQFRIWATETVKEFIIKGFAMDDERLKNAQSFGKDYFDELLERIRSIRNSERKIYQKITDIFAECSIDYDRDSPITKKFYALVQNKFHFAIAGNTAAEIVYKNADSEQVNMGLMTWKNTPSGRILKSDVSIAKNYLQEKEIKALERIVGAYFDYIEIIAERRVAMNMEDLQNSINKFLDFNEYKILEGYGKVSHNQAKDKAHLEYESFKKKQDKYYLSDFDNEIKKLKGIKDDQ